MNGFSKLVSSTLLVSALALSASAHGGGNCKDGDCDKGSCDKSERKHSHKAHKWHHKGAHGPIKMIFKELDLSDAQKDELKANLKQARKNKADMPKGQRTQALANAITKDGFNVEVYKEGAMQNSQARIERKAERLNTMLAILTPEQRQKLKELLLEKAKKRQEKKDLGY